MQLWIKNELKLLVNVQNVLKRGGRWGNPTPGLNRKVKIEISATRKEGKE
jgi:hypothetical protein